MKKNNLLHVHTTQGFVGELIRKSPFIFNYRTDEACCEIGLTMPFTAQSYSKQSTTGPGSEEMASFMGIQNDEKSNSGSESVAKAWRLLSSPNYKNASLLEQFKSITLSDAVSNGNAHLKNFG